MCKEPLLVILEVRRRHSMTSQTTNAGNVEVWYDDAVARRGNLLELRLWLAIISGR